MSEHPDWRQFKLEEEHQAYLADLATELDEEEILVISELDLFCIIKGEIPFEIKKGEE